MKPSLRLLIVLGASFAVLMLLWNLSSLLAVSVVAAAGWGLSIFITKEESDIVSEVSKIATSMGLNIPKKDLSSKLGAVLRELERKHRALVLNTVERKITTREELTETLERIVSLAYKLLEAESAELALFDPDTNQYHSSFVLGLPFQKTAQAMLASASGESTGISLSPDVMVQPIAFAGKILGSLRVGLKRKRIPEQGDREIMALLALQGSIALINAEYTSELLKMKSISEESTKAKTGFLANLSHEIRGPLGIILNAAELVLEGLCGPVTDDQAETLSMVRTNGRHLLDLINDVLDYAKVESGKVPVNKVDLIVDDMLRDICKVVQVQAQAKNHKVIRKQSEEMLVFSCDHRHARQMLINMLTNAIKYTPDGGTIEVWAERLPRNKLRINVKDSGVGIDAASRDKVFSAFERVEHSYSMQQVGTGLGMPLTKRLCEINGGTIDFSSKPGQGSHFWLVFPAVDASKVILEKKEEKPEIISGLGKSVLLLGCDPQERKTISRYLAKLGFGMSFASTKDEAVDILSSMKIDCVIADSTILENDNAELVNALREESRSSRFPAVLLTSRAFVFDVERYLRAGIDRCVPKPAELGELAKIVDDLIKGGGGSSGEGSRDIETVH